MNGRHAVRHAKSIVLVVEDEPLMRMHAVSLISEAGFETVEASNADEAIAILETRKCQKALNFGIALGHRR